MQSFKADELPVNPREKSNPLSTLMFCYTMPVFFKGRKKTLDESDLYRALNSHRSATMGNKLGAAWEAEIDKRSEKRKKPSLVRAVLSVFGLRYAIYGILLFMIEIGLRVTQPLFLGGLIHFYATTTDTQNNITTAYFYATGVILCSALNVFFMHPFSLSIQHMGMRIRLALCSVIYRKSLRLSKTALGGTTTGQVVNLISNDVGRLDQSLLQMHYLWLGPIEIIIVTYLMYREIGISSIFGVTFMLLFLPLQTYLGKKTSVLRLRTALATDERVRMMNEIISGIQVIKMYAWEKPFAKLIQEARRKEIRAVRYVNFIRGGLQSFILFMTRVTTFISLVSFVLLGNFLSAEKAFMITAFYNILRTTMTVFFPLAITLFAETMVSLKRIQTFLLYDETKVKDRSEEIANEHNQLKDSYIIKEENEKLSNGLNGNLKPLKPTLTEEKKTTPGIEIHKFKAKWDSSLSEYTLNNIELKVKPRTLVAVIGPVGSGKSSLIQAILGELPAESGYVHVDGTYSYASQEPWLFTGSVRQNILFGLPMDKIRYRTVVKRCALERDFELFPNGDKTIVGERGASLSGGQKARISLARACYRKADIYLLDDPLSAVDTRVGRHLFDQCMRGFLREEIVILSTHQLQFLEQADIIVIMDKGKISAVGTYESIHRSGLDFAKLLTATDVAADADAGAAGDNKRKRSMSRQNSAQRHNSSASLASLADSLVEETESPMQVQETREEGTIKFKLYTKYFNAAGGYLLFTIAMVLILTTQVLGSGGDYFLSYWVNKNEAQQNEETDIYIFSGIILATIFFSISRSLVFFTMASRSSISLHNSMFRGLTRAPMYFFHTNPSGRILNRFSKDMGQVDELLPGVMLDVIQISLLCCGSVLLISIVNVWNLLTAFILGIIFYYIRRFYLQTSRDVKRLESITRSPIYSHMSASLNGLSTIRAFGAQKILTAEFDNYQDLHSSGYYMFLSTSRAFGYWLDCFCVLYLAITTLSFFFFSPDNGGNVGLSITQAMGLTGMIQWGMRQSAELENNMTCVERVLEYNEIESEGDMESRPAKKPPKTWPEQGKIKFDKLSLRYFPDPTADRVLKGLNLEIEPCEKIGIVGRTGAGKSSLINALFRLSYNDGAVIIDARDTNDLGLHDLRSKISIIPQEPVLFSGTMRYNLDPFDEYADAKLWEALDEVELKGVVSDLPTGLQSKISEGGTNFSVGQRQLVCLARAILRENKILVLDEATANVDPQTDALIQKTIRSKFRNCTVLTIAHRLHTIMDSDKVLVMDAGRAVEYGSPFELLTVSKTNIFHGMLKQAGDSTFDNLLLIAQKAHEENLRAKKDT